MSAAVFVCGNMFDGSSEGLSGPAEILVEGNRIASIGRPVNRPPGAQVIDLSDRTVTPGFIDTHVHLTMDAANLVQQTLESSASKALKGPSPRTSSARARATAICAAFIILDGLYRSRPSLTMPEVLKPWCATNWSCAANQDLLQVGPDGALAGLVGPER
ncbi:MAG: hypothetical protein ACREP9_03920 [Candidatus Dormibacteraceae bacterium]